MTEEKARAIATDAANENMRKGGREKWNKDDFYIASRKYNELWPTSAVERWAKKSLTTTE